MNGIFIEKNFMEKQADDNNAVSRICESLQVFIVGAFGYSAIELACRGFTHSSMFFTGGLCFLLLHHIYHYMGKGRILLKCLIGAVLITTLEFIVGCAVNLWLGLNVWNYNTLPLNLFGQVCLLFTAAWFLLSLPIMLLSKVMKKTVRAKLYF